jgi:hypothetical protein
LLAYSRGEISRAELERRIGDEVSYADLIAKLRTHQLHLPKTPSDPQSRGAQLIRDIAARGIRGPSIPNSET